MPGNGKEGGNEACSAPGLHPERGGWILEDLYADVRGICLGSGAVLPLCGCAGGAFGDEREEAFAAVSYRRLTGIKIERRSAETGQNNRKAANERKDENYA